MSVSIVKTLYDNCVHLRLDNFLYQYTFILFFHLILGFKLFDVLHALLSNAD